MHRIGDSLKNKKVLITQSDDFMGPFLREAFEFYNADVYCDSTQLLSRDSINKIVEKTGPIDVLIINLVHPLLHSSYEQIDHLTWKSFFTYMVDPLPNLAKAVLPHMIEKKQGKIVVMGSLTANSGLFGNAGYNAARGAQLSWVKKMGMDMAPHNIQINYIAQAFVYNDTFYSDKVPQNLREEQLKQVPAGRLADSHECTALAIFLSSFESNFFAGQCFSIAGGLT